MIFSASRYEDVDVDGQAAKTVHVQRHPARDRVRDAQIVESARDPCSIVLKT